MCCFFLTGRLGWDAGQGRAHAAEQRKERELLEETIHSIQLESALTSRALKQTVTVRTVGCDVMMCNHIFSASLPTWKREHA